jgi:hypothetical protein
MAQQVWQGVQKVAGSGLGRSILNQLARFGSWFLTLWSGYEFAKVFGKKVSNDMYYMASTDILPPLK